MNSTVSHEMRNPLNAIVSHSEKLENSTQDLRLLLEKRDMSVEEKAEFDNLLEKFDHSLRVSSSSTNLIKFNVEDILALPQLKSGKFTKSIQESLINPAIQEIIDIMSHQSEAKNVRVTFQTINFPEQIPIDKQRF